jgi:hypothetical protein
MSDRQGPEMHERRRPVVVRSGFLTPKSGFYCLADSLLPAPGFKPEIRPSPPSSGQETPPIAL